ncbi:anthrone oxygenase family protein [Embleya hyalina]|uniref:Membrane protein n=1 Tax=Embleya hyalina TaxID=516124 RepID=A0A401YQ11_9ACTN|nr:anthrone oxygenase family protein [Embleya hyalina]GCD96683.1 membrane protein [Embleya hyalina]
MAAIDHTLAAGSTATARTRTAVGRWLTAGAVANTLMAGTYVAFSAAVMPWLGTKDDADFVTTMRDINTGIENPLFFAVFTAAMAAPAVAAWKLRRLGGGTAMKWALAALALYTTTVLTTSGINVPLNQMLAHAGTTDPTTTRTDFETTWNIWNGIRAALSTAAALAMVKAVRLHRRNRV